MGTWLARRLLAAVAIVFAVVTLTFFLMHLGPVSPIVPSAEQPLDPDVVARLRQQFGLDQSLPVQYGRYLAQLARGNLGVSFSQRRPVTAALADAIPNTLLLAGTALLIDFGLGLLLGVVMAARARRRLDAALGNTTLFLRSVPTFWLALIVLLVFGEWLRWFPVGGVIDIVRHQSLSLAGRLGDRLWHLALPALTLGIVGAAGTARFQRSATLDALSADYVRTARAKGATERRIVLVHALRNALLPAITLFGLALPFLITGAVLIETVFAWPGMGKLAADAIFSRDYPVVLACALAASAMVVVGNLAADLLYAVADPRIRIIERERA
jgi:peptide/nickel transport system permease protein